MTETVTAAPKTKIERLEAQLRIERAKETVRKNRARKTEETLITRKKIIVGGYLLKHFETRPDFRDWIVRQLDAELKRASDRALFGLPPLEPSKQKTEIPTAKNPAI